MTIQVNFVKRHKNSPELSLLNFLPLIYHHSHFLAATLDFTSFFTIAFLRAAHFFTAWLFWIRFHFFLYLYTPKPVYGQLWDFFNLCFFFFTTGRRKDEVDVLYFISKCTNYIYNTYVTRFAKRGLPHTSNLPTLTIDNFRLERAIALKFGQW